MIKFTQLLSIVTPLYILVIGFLFLYSFTQIDLNMTLPDTSVWYPLQQFFQRIGYFNRPLSGNLYLFVITLLFTAYAALLVLARQKVLTQKTCWFLIGASVGVLFFSYPAFSYDIYNYMFDARVVTHYGQNPYVHKALDYPNDPWLLVMRWTHRTYPYGPLWLGLTVPLSFIGFQKFVFTLFMFKALMVVSYVASIVAIKQIMRQIHPTHVIFSVIFFAINPLILIESIVSGHNDIVMMAGALWSFYFLILKKYRWSIILLIASIAIKFATVLLIPAYIYVWYLQYHKKKILWERVIYIVLVGMVGAVIAATIRTQFQPWYLLYPLAFAPLVSHKYYIVIPSVILSIAGLLQYTPYLYTGNWNPPIPTILTNVMLIAVALSLVSTLVYRFVKGKHT